MPTGIDLPLPRGTGRTETRRPGRLRFQILGPLRVWRDDLELDTGPKQQRNLLALLLARAGRPVRVGEMLDVLWPGDPPASAVNIIYKYIGALRRLMEPDLGARRPSSWLVRHGDSYRFIADPETLDVATFRHHLDRARTAARNGRGAEALEHYHQGLELWSGLCAEDLAESTEGSAMFSAINRQLFDAALETADLALRERQSRRHLSLLRRVASWDRLNEPLHARLMLLLHEAGHQAEAFVVYDELRGLLADELGLDPGPELRAVRQQILTSNPPDEAEDQVSPAGGEPERVAGGPDSADVGPGRVATVVVRPAQLPADLRMFVGRQSETAFVQALCERRGEHPHSGPLVVALSGMAGVGKSTLAVHLGHVLSPQHSDGQLYLDLSGSDPSEHGISPRKALEVLLHSLGVPAGSVPDQVDAQIGMYRSLTADKRIILLLDNARTIQQVRPLVPNSGQGLVIVTSRRPLAGLAAVEGANLLPIDLPSLPSAREILLSRLRGFETTPDLAIIDEIVELCGRLPLALALVAARAAARPWLSLTAVIAELRSSSTRLDAFPRDEGHNDPRSIFAWSYRQLSEGAARLFRFLSISVGPAISEAACASLLGVEPVATRLLLGELLDSALISEVAVGRYSSHVLVRAYAEELLLSTDPPAVRREAGSRLLQHYLHSSYAAHIAVRPHFRPVPPPQAVPGVFPEKPQGFEAAMAWFAVERQVLVSAVLRASDQQFHVEPWRLALTVQQYFQRAGFFHDWKEVMNAAVSAARRDHHHFGAAYALRSLAGAHYFLGDNDEALKLLDAAEELFTSLGRSEERGYVHCNRGDVLVRLGRYDDAFAQYQAAHALFKVSGNTQREVRAMSEMGHALALRGDYDNAEMQLDSALLRNSIVGHLEQEGQIRVYRACLHTKRGDFLSAVEELEAGVLLLHRVGHRTLEIDALQVLAETWLALGQVGRARTAWRDALSILQSFQNGGPVQISERLKGIERRLLRDGSRSG